MTLFSIVLTAEQLELIGCDHNADPDVPWEPYPGCRPCSITVDLFDAIDLHELELKAYADPLTLCRRYEGVATGESARRALCRMQALAMSHPEPLVPEDAGKAREAINEYA